MNEIVWFAIFFGGLNAILLLCLIAAILLWKGGGDD